MLTKVSRLCDKVVQVKLTIRRVATTRKDAALTSRLQQQERDAGLQVFTKLFQDKDSPINQIMRKVNEVYAYHRTSTLPFVDAGPRLLPNALYFEYTQEMKKRIAEVDSLMATYLPLYDQLVLDDVAYRNAGSAAGRANANEYPTAQAFERAMAIEFRFSPMPDASHFLFDLSEDDLAAFDAAEQEAAQLANQDTIRRMLEPLKLLMARLDEYRGDKGQRWHNSVMENVLEGCRQARKLALHPSSELLAQIDELEQHAAGLLATVEVIKGSANARADARAKLQQVADKMGMFG